MKGLDFWMTWYFRLPGEELQADLPIGSKCVRVQMDMWDSSVNLVPQDFVMNRQMEVRLHLVCLAIAMDMQISVTLRLVSGVLLCRPVKTVDKYIVCVSPTLELHLSTFIS
jgi:hypothetical protein